MTEPRAYTTDEVREQFLQSVWEYVRYWQELPDKTTDDRLKGLAFGILCLLDGVTVTLPAFQVVPYPHPDDREWRVLQGDNYYSQSEPNDNDIAGGLHELFYSAR